MEETGRDTVARWISVGMVESEIGDIIQTREPQGADETCGAIMDEILESWYLYATSQTSDLAEQGTGK